MKHDDLPKSAAALLARLAQQQQQQQQKQQQRQDEGPRPRAARGDAERLIAADLARRGSHGLVVTAAGRAYLRRHAADDAADPFRAQHLSLGQRLVATEHGCAEVAVDEAESPLAWLARRKGRHGRPLIEAVQLQAGERLRADFTRAQMTPRVTSTWDAPAARGRRSVQSAGADFTETVVAARMRLRHALDAVGPEFAGLLLDLCCFLKGLEDIERERRWPPRSGKVIAQLGLDRLARHYGLAGEARGRDCVPIRTWSDGDGASAAERG